MQRDIAHYTILNCINVRRVRKNISARVFWRWFAVPGFTLISDSLRGINIQCH